MYMKHIEMINIPLSMVGDSLTLQIVIDSLKSREMELKAERLEKRGGVVHMVRGRSKHCSVEIKIVKTVPSHVVMVMKRRVTIDLDQNWRKWVRIAKVVVILVTEIKYWCKEKNKQKDIGKDEASVISSFIWALVMLMS